MDLGDDLEINIKPKISRAQHVIMGIFLGLSILRKYMLEADLEAIGTGYFIGPDIEPAKMDRADLSRLRELDWKFDRTIFQWIYYPSIPFEDLEDPDGTKTCGFMC